MAKAAKQAEVTHPHPGEILASKFFGPQSISPETLAESIVPHGT